MFLKKYNLISTVEIGVYENAAFIQFLCLVSIQNTYTKTNVVLLIVIGKKNVKRKRTNNWTDGFLVG